MGTSYQATLPVQCLKEHTCVCCSGKFSYLLSREIKAEGPTQQAALENAQGMAIKSMENDVDFHPCPICGIVQPEMTADVKSSWYLFGMLIALIVLGVAFFCALAQGMRISTSATTALIGMIVGMLVYARGAFYNPNTSPQLNLSNAQSSIQSKQLIVTEEVHPSAVHDEFGGIKSGDIKGFIVGGIAMLVLAAPLYLPVVSGWHLNDSIYPAVAGAGDKPTVYFDSKIKSLKSYWNSSATAQVKNATELGMPASLEANSKESSWGNTISGKSLSNNTNTMWAQVKIPDGDFAGKSAKLDLRVSASFPFEAAGGFVINSQQFAYSTEIKLSGKGAGSSYYKAWLWGQIGVFVLILVGAGFHFGVCTWLRQQGHPTSVTTLGEAAEDGADEELEEGADEALGEHGFPNPVDPNAPDQSPG